jgi:hypothetical protein
VFALLSASALTWLVQWGGRRPRLPDAGHANDRRGRLSPHQNAIFLYLFACALSHPLLDALTNGGRGVALLLLQNLIPSDTRTVRGR